MNLTATYRFDAPLSRVWDLLMDTDAIAGCLPGCKGLGAIGENRYEADLVAGVAAVTGTFKAVMTLEDLQPPEAYTLRVDATGRPGFVRGLAHIRLADDQGGTTVHVTATADVGGTIARVGQRLLEGVARMTMDRFYGCLMSRVAREGGVP